MNRLLDRPRVDEAAVAAAVEDLRDRGATWQGCIHAEGTTAWVNAVNAGGSGWSTFSEVASRRAAIGGRRLLPVLDCGEVDGRLWIAYDMGSATLLPDHRARRPLSTAFSMRVLSDVARALDEAAAKGVFASELPPSSVFVAGKGARLGDLGTAREGLAGSRFELRGDPSYVPPEVLRGKRAGESSGVYLFGALLHYLLTGMAPRRGRAAPRESGQPDLPASIKAVVCTATAEDPDERPQTVSEAHEMAKRALRGEPPKRNRPKVAVGKRGAPKVAARKRDASNGAAREGNAANGAAPKRKASNVAAPKRTAPTTAARKRTAPTTAARERTALIAAARKRAASITAPRQRAALIAAARRRAASSAMTARRAGKRISNAGTATLRSGAAKVPQRVQAIPVTPWRALAVGGAVVLGSGAGLLLGGSPDPDRGAQTVTAGGLSVTLPSGPHRVEPRGRGLTVRGPGSLFRARIVSSPVRSGPGARPVRLGALEAWRDAAGGVVRYSVPTSRGTLAVTCRTTAPAGSRALRLCERTASTLRLRDARTLPLAAAAARSRRLRTTIAALESEREAGRATLGSAFTPEEQRLAAEDLAKTHARAATALREVPGAERVAAAANGAAGAYARLAEAVESGSPDRWIQASEHVRRSDAALADAIAVGAG